MTALNAHGFETAFPIQAATIADALAGKDVLAKARTGSGKTLGFGLPAIAAMARAPRPRPKQVGAVVLVPTRELAMQVNDALEPFAHSMHVSIRLVAGGLSMTKQIRALERGVHIVVATPGRLMDLVRRGHADLSAASLVVLDEADHMVQMGFIEDIETILGGTAPGGQRLLFSATLDGDVDKVINTHLNKPVLHDVTKGQSPSTVRHVMLSVAPPVKYQVATRMAAREGRTLVFVRTKLGADRVAEQMREAGVLAIALHGDRSQAERTFAITGFRAGHIPVLVATDVAARGLHIDQVDLVIQVDPPADHKDYTHRTGRTGRAGKSGLAVTLVLPHQRRTVERMLESTSATVETRKVDTRQVDSVDALDELTGGRQPSGVPVSEPQPERQFRRLAPGKGKRPAAGYRDRRSSDADARSGSWSRGPASAHREDDLSERARRLDERERDLASREAALAQREAHLAQGPSSRTSSADDSHPPSIPPASRRNAPASGQHKGKSKGPRNSQGQGQDSRQGAGGPQGKSPRKGASTSKRSGKPRHKKRKS